MNLQKEKQKKKVFFILYLFFSLVTVVAAIFTIADKINNPGYVVISMLFAMVFDRLYKNSKKAIEENKE